MALTVVSRTVAFAELWLNPPSSLAPTRVINCGAVSDGDSAIIGIVEPNGPLGSPSTNIGSLSEVHQNWVGTNIQLAARVMLIPVLTTGTLQITFSNINTPYAITVTVLSEPAAFYAFQRGGYPSDALGIAHPITPIRPLAVPLPDGEWYGLDLMNLDGLISAALAGPAGWSSIIGPKNLLRGETGVVLSRRYAIMDRISTGGGSEQPTWILSPNATQWATSVVVFVESLVVDFTADVTSGAAPLTVNFSYTGYGTPDQYRWVFGDNTESTSAAPSHVYAEGTYTVTLYVSRANGFVQQNKTRVAYIVVGAGGGDGGTPTDPRTPYPTQHSLSVLAAAYPVLYAWMNQQPPILTPPLPEPDLTALEVEQEILNLNLLREMVQAISTEQGSSDPVRLSEAVRQMTRVVDGLLYVNQLQMTGDGEYELITGGWSDADAPTSNDLAGDGEVWIEWPSVYRSRRDRMPPDTEDESDPTLWVSVVQDDGSVLWFEVELYPEGWTSLGVTGTF